MSEALAPLSSARPLPSMMDRLRDETLFDRHAAEYALELPRRFASLAAYRRFLTGLYGFYMSLEYTLSANLPRPLASLGTFTKSAFLADDLRILGADEDVWSSLPASAFLLPIPTKPTATGSLYAIEVAFLGGVMIAAQASDALQLHDGRGTRFFHGLGPEKGERWVAFHRTVNELPFTAEEQTESVKGAKSTFQSFRRMLESVD